MSIEARYHKLVDGLYGEYSPKAERMFKKHGSWQAVYDAIQACPVMHHHLLPQAHRECTTKKAAEPARALVGLVALSATLILPDPKAVKKAFLDFIDDSIKQNCLGYLLFGTTKPATLCDGNSATPEFRKYQHLINHPDIIVCIEDELIFDKGNKQGLKRSVFNMVSFVNKKTLRATLIECEADFKEVLGNDFSPDKFLAEVEANKSWNKLIQHDEKLRGIVLGFGRESAGLYKRRGESAKPKDISRFYSFQDFFPTRTLKSPMFACMQHSKEVQDLLVKYRKEHLEINALYDTEGLDPFLRALGFTNP